MITVPGHRLVEAGRAYGDPKCAEVVCVAYGRRRVPPDAGGHAACECGQMSLHLDSNRERRDWHRKHKLRLVEVQDRTDWQIDGMAL